MPVRSDGGVPRIVDWRASPHPVDRRCSGRVRISGLGRLRCRAQQLGAFSDQGLLVVSKRYINRLAEAGIAPRSVAAAIQTTMPWPTP
jgi:hypothetical protein